MISVSCNLGIVCVVTAATAGTRKASEQSSDRRFLLGREMRHKAF